MREFFKIFFILLILISLVTPLLFTETENIAKQENRTLAQFPKIIKRGTINTDYGKEFESWIGDHFWGRDQLIDIRFQTLYKINGRIENNKAFVGDDGWMFEKSKTVNIPSIEKQREEIENDAKILKNFANKFKDKNIPVYLIIVPDREKLYQKYWKKYYKPKPKLDYGKKMMELLSNCSNIKICYVCDVF